MPGLQRLHKDEGVALVRTRDKGKAVLALRDFAAGEMVCSCPVIVLPSDQEVPNTVLSDYYMYWDEGNSAIACGYAQFLNHAELPNVRVARDYAAETMEVFALRPIHAGEELTCRYVCGAWFTPRPPIDVSRLMSVVV
jgi:hypothetical protein